VSLIRDPTKRLGQLTPQYCTSGDLGTLIRKAQRSNTPLNEDKIWNIFLQIVQALHHCHWPEERAAAGRMGVAQRGGATGAEKDREARYQVMHRDLKPENGVLGFLSGHGIKLTLSVPIG
jgi:serine/threonine protein kinase